MIFTWSTQDLCIIFHWWHIHSSLTLFMSLLGVVILTAGYELVRELARRYDASANSKIQSMPGESLIHCARCPGWRLQPNPS